MSTRARLVHGLWAAASYREHRRYRAALADPARAQRRLLSGYLGANADTAWGRAHGFANLRTAQDYAAHQPLTRWRDYQPYVERIMAGESNVLTRSQVSLLEPSSGSTAACKLVPYTGHLQREFNRAISAWVRQMFRAWPALSGGPAYWSVSPVGNHELGLTSQVPVGFNDDSEYLGGVLGRLVSSVLAVPAAVRHIENIETFRYVTLLHLLRARNLRLISVWHPSYLRLLLDFLPDHWDALRHDLATGEISPPQALSPDLHQKVAGSWRPVPERAAELANLDPREPAALWPQLALLSCWADGHAVGPAGDLNGLFPAVSLQPKGLIATEAIVTIPYADHTPLAIRSHYFEFVADNGEVLPVERLELGQEYSVVVTTGGGLYRYCLGDRVRVDGMVGRTPSLRFLGKEDFVSDLRGEKLSEGFVAAALRRALNGVEPVFAMLAPDTRGRTPGYTLFVQEPVPENIAAALESELLANPHYRYCRALSQLLAVRECRLNGNVYARYANRCAQLGQRLGDVKPIALSVRDDWEDYLIAVACGSREKSEASG